MAEGDDQALRETNASEATADGSTSGQHPEIPTPTHLVGPATADQKNTIRPILAPIACWRLDDIRFDFDSSFVRPDAEPDLKVLGVLIKRHPKSPLSIFGHADPVGSEAYNKRLSGRRAMAIYGVLTRNVEMWENLYSNPYEGDKWGSSQILTILSSLAYAPAADDGLKAGRASNSLKQFQSDNGLTPHGYVNVATRKKLFGAYMNRLCGPGLKLQKSDFLAQGADQDGRGDYQGCSEFNPLMLLSKDENTQFSKPGNEAQRNAVNAPNRRVMVMLFRPDVKVSPAQWPCPKADTEQVQGCKKRFWSDGQQRLENTDRRRTYTQDKNTFACRFYDRLANSSPCERTQENWVLRILVAGKGSLQGRKPLANEAYTLAGLGGGKPEIRGRTDQRGILRAVVADDVCKMTLTIAGIKITVEGGALHSLTNDAAVKERLLNLGYGDRDLDSWTTDTYTSALKAFQKDHKLGETGTADDPTRQKIKELHGG
jgi:peptidoglycan hydrolase-like protein with peptidoglycan-binding domain